MNEKTSLRFGLHLESLKNSIGPRLRNVDCHNKRRNQLLIKQSKREERGFLNYDSRRSDDAIDANEF